MENRIDGTLNHRGFKYDIGLEHPEDLLIDVYDLLNDGDASSAMKRIWWWREKRLRIEWMKGVLEHYDKYLSERETT